MKFATILEQLEMENLAKREDESPGERYRREYLELKEKHKEKMRKQLLLETLKSN